MKGTIIFENNDERISYRKFALQYCKVCGTKEEYSEKHDAEFCPNCNEWTIPVCTNPSCKFCADRPDKPITEE